MTERTEWRLVGERYPRFRVLAPGVAPDVRTELHVVVDSTDPDVVAAIETAAADAGLTLERVEQPGA